MSTKKKTTTNVKQQQPMLENVKESAPMTQKVKESDVLRIMCNGCQNCVVTCTDGVYMGTCKKKGALLKLVYSGTAIFLLKDEKCRERI